MASSRSIRLASPAARNPKLAMAAGVLGVVSVATMVVGCIVVPETTLVPKDAIKSTGAATDKGMDLEQLAALRGQASPSVPDISETAAADGAADFLPEQPEVASEPSGIAIPEGPFSLHISQDALAQGLYGPVLIGDSVPGDTPFYEVFPDGLNDSYVGRRPLEALSVYRDYAAQGVVGNVVVFASFSNTTPFPDQLAELVESVGADKSLYLVGTVNAEGFQDDANANLIECAAQHENVHYVDWPAVCMGNEDVYLYADGTHLTPDGAWAYLDMIARAVAGDMFAAGAWPSAR